MEGTDDGNTGNNIKKRARETNKKPNISGKINNI